MHLPQHGGLIERVTDFVAVFGVLSWLNPRVFTIISDYSQLAGLLLPILGCFWLAVQIVVRIAKGN